MDEKEHSIQCVFFCKSECDIDSALDQSFV